MAETPGYLRHRRSEKRAHRTGFVEIVEINRPPRNVIDWELLDEIARLLAELEADGECCGIVLASAVAGCFSEGFDHEQMLSERVKQHLEDRNTSIYSQLRERYQQIKRSPLPVIAAIDGTCYSAGLELALACDVRIATEQSKFRFVELLGAKHGIIPGLGGCYLSPQYISRGRMFHLYLRPTGIATSEAYEWGIVDKIAKREDLEKTAVDFLRFVTVETKEAYACFKRCVSDAFGDDVFNDNLEKDSFCHLLRRHFGIEQKWT